MTVLVALRADRAVWIGADGRISKQYETVTDDYQKWQRAGDLWWASAGSIRLNALAETNTKIPQTEQGMAVLRAAAIQVCQQAVTNGFLAPGTWNGNIPFGDPTTFDNNIAQSGFYVYTNPIATQSQAARSARQAPVMQIAGKEAGAVQSANILVYVQP